MVSVLTEPPTSSISLKRSPVTTPSFFTAASTSNSCSQACPAAIMCSLRSSIHFTGRPDLIASNATITTYLRIRWIF